MNSKVVDEIKIKGGRMLKLVEGDITERNVDVIVNPANSYLKHGGGVAGTIVRKGGSMIQEESDKIGFLQVGSSAITSSGTLPCKAIIHTVGPRMGEGYEDEKLSKAINSCLQLGFKNNPSYLMCMNKLSFINILRQAIYHNKHNSEIIDL